jgi:predicted transcriptional regulator
VRYRFGPTFEQAIRVRGLDLTRIAAMANVAPSTVSSAIRGKRLNVSTALRIAKAVAQCEIVPELESWSADERIEGCT